MQTGSQDVQREEEEGYRNLQMDDKAREVKQADRDAKKSRTP